MPQLSLPATPVTAPVQAAVDTVTTVVDQTAAPVAQAATQAVEPLPAKPVATAVQTVQQTAAPAVRHTVTVAAAAAIRARPAAQTPERIRPATIVRRASTPTVAKPAPKPVVRQAAKPASHHAVRRVAVHAAATRSAAARPAPKRAAAARASRASSAVLGGDDFGSGAFAGAAVLPAGSSVPVPALAFFAPPAAPGGARVFPPESLLGRGFTPLLVLERPD